jgi:hypothetical protein
MYYIGLDVHMKTISYCVKDASGQVHHEGKVGATRWELDDWMKTLPQPWTVAMEATIFTGWIYDHLLPHAQQVKVAHPLMLRAIAAAKKKNDRIDAGKIADCLRCDFLPECPMASTAIRDRRRTLRYRHLLVRQMVQMKNRISGLLMETGGVASWIPAVSIEEVRNDWFQCDSLMPSGRDSKFSFCERIKARTDAPRNQELRCKDPCIFGLGRSGQVEDFLGGQFHYFPATSDVDGQTQAGVFVNHLVDGLLKRYLSTLLQRQSENALGNCFHFSPYRAASAR